MSGAAQVPRLDRRMVLEGPLRVADGAGGYETTWAVRGVIWAMLRPGSGREVAGEEMRIAETPYRITVRAAPPGAEARPRPEDRLRDGTRLFTILAVTEADARGQYLTCFAKEEGAA